MVSLFILGTRTHSRLLRSIAIRLLFCRSSDHTSRHVSIHMDGVRTQLGEQHIRDVVRPHLDESDKIAENVLYANIQDLTKQFQWSENVKQKGMMKEKSTGHLICF